MRIIVSTFAILCITAASTSMAGDRVIARVGNEAVTAQELSEALVKEPGLTRQKALELLIERRLVLVWAAARNISVSEDELEQTMTSIRQRNNLSEEQFREVLEDRGESIEIFEATLREQLIINKALGAALSSRVQIEEDELQEAYRETYPRKTAYRVSHILLTLDREASGEEEARVRQEAQEILAEINAGSSFDGMALKHSQDATTSSKGGQLGTFSAGELLPELEELAAALEPGDVGGPVRTAAGYHILLLEARELTEPPPLEEVRGSLERSLMARMEESVRTEWLEELKGTTYIEVFPDDGS